MRVCLILLVTGLLAIQGFHLLSVVSLTSSLHDKSNKGVAAMAIKVLKFPFIMY